MSEPITDWKARAEKAEAALGRVRALALGEYDEEWVRAAGPLGTVARSAILAALDGE